MGEAEQDNLWGQFDKFEGKIYSIVRVILTVSQLYKKCQML